jgi:glycosyltransferase involved in cell wall biosynthesis
MRILQLCHKPPLPAKDGGCIAMNNLTQGLLQAGHKVKVLTIYTPKHDLHLDEMPAEYLEKTDIEGVFVDTSINVVDAYIAIMTNDSYHVNRFFSPDMDIRIERVLKKTHFDAIILESLFITPYIPTIKKNKKNAPLILRAHNIEYSIWEKIALRTKNPIKKIYLNHLTRQLKEFECTMYNLVDGIATIADSDKIRMMQLGTYKPIRTISFGLNLNEYQPGIERNVNLFHIGAMDWAPNIEGLQHFVERTWPALSEEFPNLQLLLAGRNMPDSWKNWNIPNLQIIGEVEDAHAFMKENGIMIVPLLSGGGIRVKIIEGLALGKVVISTTIGAIGIEDKNDHPILIADNLAEWKDQISSVIHSAEKRNEIGAKSRSFAEQYFNHHHITAELIHFIKQVGKK